MEVSQKVKQQRSICEFLFCFKNEAQTRTEKELRAQLDERAVPKSALFSFIERPQGVPLFRVFQKIQFGTDRAAGVLLYLTPGPACRVSVSPGEGFRLSSHFEASFPPSKKEEGANIQSQIS